MLLWWLKPYSENEPLSKLWTCSLKIYTVADILLACSWDMELTACFYGSQYAWITSYAKTKTLKQRFVNMLLYRKIVTKMKYNDNKKIP